jgi:hypothetical protein
MLSTHTTKTPTFEASKLNYKSSTRHPLARFVTVETVSLLFNRSPDEIYRIECWQHIVYVHGKGLSRFVSYADFPPILEAEPPTPQDMVRWRKRWKSPIAPEFWTTFYRYQFNRATSESQLLAWGQFVGIVKGLLSTAALQHLRQRYQLEQYWWRHF